MAAGALTDAAQEDAALVNAMDACERYLDNHERAEKLLKQGFLKLAMARRHLPTHALSELSFHEAFDALTVVSVHTEGDDTWQIVRSVSTEQPKTSEPSATLKHRKKTAQREEGGATERKQGEDEAQSTQDTILWFSSLPPNDLRQAQKLFASGLQALLDAAASARKVQAAVK